MDDVRDADRTAEGARARDAGQWEAARAAFAAAVAADDGPAARDGLGEALWFLGSVEEGLAERGRASEGYARAGRPHEAARCAVWVAHQHAVSGRMSAARGWLARAERALEGADRGFGHGWVAIERARHAEGVDECAAHARAALELAREIGESDVEVYALSLLGRAEVAAGRRAPGMRLLDEAMAAASAGRVEDIHTLGEAYCNLITACTSAGEWERASEWCELVHEYARSIDATPLFGACRTIHADVLLASGRWEEAERALESALDAHARHTPAMGVPTTATLAE